MRGARDTLPMAYLRAFYILVRFPQVMLGPLLVAVLQVALHSVMPGGEGLLGAANSGLAGLFDQLLSSFGVAVAIIVADSAWRYNRAPFDDAWDHARRYGGDIIMASLGVSFVVFLAAYVGALVGQFGIVLVALASFFMVYALPAAAIGGIPGMGSLQISIDRARANPGPTAAIALVYFLAIGIGPSILLTFVAPLLNAHLTWMSDPVLKLTFALIKAPFGAYVGIMLAKTYESVSYGRLR